MWKRKRFSNITREKIAAQQSWLCSHCRQMLHHTFELDHIIPLQSKGTDTIENLQALCPNCHAKKSKLENESRLNRNMNPCCIFDISLEVANLISYDILVQAEQLIQMYWKTAHYRLEAKFGSILQTTSWGHSTQRPQWQSPWQHVFDQQNAHKQIVLLHLCFQLCDSCKNQPYWNPYLFGADGGGHSQADSSI